MHMYIVPKGTKGKLLTQESGKDIQINDYTTRKTLEFGDEQLIMDYVRYKNAGGGTPRNVAERLVARGYSIFCMTNVNDKYLIAIPSPAIEVL